MSITFNTENDQLNCIFSGRMDTVSCLEDKEELIKEIADYEGKLVFDMGEVDYISSSFLRICMEAANKVQPENFSIIKITPNIKKVFKIAGLEGRLNIS